METIYTSYVRSKSFFHFFLPSLSLSLSLFFLFFLSGAESLSRKRYLSSGYYCVLFVHFRTNDRLLWKIMLGSGDWNVTHPRIWVAEWNTYDARIANSRGLRFHGCSRLITRRGGFFASVKLEAGTKCCDNAILPAPVFVTRSILGSKPRIDRGSILFEKQEFISQILRVEKVGNASSIISFYASGRFAEKRTSLRFIVSNGITEPPKDYANRIHSSN